MYWSSGLQRLGRQVLLDDDEPEPVRVGETDQSLAQLAGGRIRPQALHPDLLDAEALRGRGQAAGDPLDVLDGEVERRPDVEQHAVQLVATLRRERRLDPADALECVEQYPLELRQGDDPTVLVAYGCQVADLAHRQQTLVLGVAVGDGAGEVDVLGGAQALDGEVDQPPELQPLDHQRMQAVERVVVHQVAVGTRYEGQVAHRAEAVRRAGAAHGHDHPFRVGRERRREDLGERRRSTAPRRSDPPRPPTCRGRTVTGSPDGSVAAAVTSARAATSSSAGGAAVVSTWIGPPSGRSMVAARTSRPSTVSGAHVAGIATPVVAADHRLEHDRTGRRRIDPPSRRSSSGASGCGQSTRAAMWIVALRVRGVGDEGGEVDLHRLVRCIAGGSQPGFVDDAEADLTGQVGDDRDGAAGRRRRGRRVCGADRRRSCRPAGPAPASARGCRRPPGSGSSTRCCDWWIQYRASSSSGVRSRSSTP